MDMSHLFAWHTSSPSYKILLKKVEQFRSHILDKARQMDRVIPVYPISSLNKEIHE